MTVETIGRCELCGLVDHHLVEAECPRCRTLYGCRTLSGLLAPDAVGDDSSQANEPLERLPMGDESDVTHVLALRGAALAMGPDSY